MCCQTRINNDRSRMRPVFIVLNKTVNEDLLETRCRGSYGRAKCIKRSTLKKDMASDDEGKAAIGRETGGIFLD